jgi:hypothetical protein
MARPALAVGSAEPPRAPKHMAGDAYVLLPSIFHGERDLKLRTI